MQNRRPTHIGTIELSWAGKAEAVAQATARNQSRLELCLQSTTDRHSGNFIVEGDNLDALRLLVAEYAGAVQAIYIDPPYNTGNGFVYRDRREHTVWLSMMLPRLMLARELLSEDGAIFVSIDDHEVDKLRLLMSEVFGEQNFVAQITVQSNPRGRQADKHFATVHEYIVVFARHHERCRLNGTVLNESQQREFPFVDEHGKRYRLLGLRQRGSASLREDRPAMYYPVWVDPEHGTVSLDKTRNCKIAVYPKKSTGQAGRWMWGLDRARRDVHLMEARLIARRQEWDIFVRDYLHDGDGNCRTRKLKTIWDDKELNYQNGKRELKELLGEAPVDYPKPLALISKIIDLFSDRDALFVDFFAGSGTLAHAVLLANTIDGGNRRFGLVQLPEKTNNPRFETIADICRARVDAVLERINSEHIAAEAGDKRRSSPVGYRYYEVVDPTARLANK